MRSPACRKNAKRRKITQAQQQAPVDEPQQASLTCVPSDVLELVLPQASLAKGHSPHEVCKEWCTVMRPAAIMAEWLRRCVADGDLKKALRLAASCPDETRALHIVQHLPRPTYSTLQQLVNNCVSAMEQAGACGNRKVCTLLIKELEGMHVLLQEQGDRVASAELAGHLVGKRAAVVAAQLESAHVALKSVCWNDRGEVQLRSEAQQQGQLGAAMTGILTLLKQKTPMLVAQEAAGAGEAQPQPQMEVHRTAEAAVAGVVAAAAVEARAPGAEAAAAGENDARSEGAGTAAGRAVVEEAAGTSVMPYVSGYCRVLSRELVRTRVQLIVAGAYGAARVGRAGLLFSLLRDPWHMKQPAHIVSESFTAALRGAVSHGQLHLCSAVWRWAQDHSPQNELTADAYFCPDILEIAVRAGHERLVEWLLLHGVGRVDLQGAITAAAELQRVDIVTALVDISPICASAPALTAAAAQGHEDVVRAILHAWSDRESDLETVSDSESDSESDSDVSKDLSGSISRCIAHALQEAVQAEQLSVVEVFADIYGEARTLSSCWLQHMLAAAHDGKGELAFVLLSGYTNRSKQSINKQACSQALEAAVQHGDMQLAIALLEASPCIVSPGALEASLKLSPKRRRSMWALLLKHVGRTHYNVLHGPALHGDRKQLRALLRAGVPGSHAGSCALAAAAGGVVGTDAQRASLCKLLIKHGADVQESGSAALLQAAKCGRHLTCEALVAAGAKKDVVVEQAMDMALKASTDILSTVRELEHLLYSNMLPETIARDLFDRVSEALGVAKQVAKRASQAAAQPAPWQRTSS